MADRLNGLLNLDDLLLSGMFMSRKLIYFQLYRQTLGSMLAIEGLLRDLKFPCT